LNKQQRLRYLEIPFIRNGYERDNYANMLERSDNQEAIQEMVRLNPLFQEGRFKKSWSDYIASKQRGGWANLPSWSESVAPRVEQERWQEIAQQERREEDVRSGFQFRLPDGGLFTAPAVAINQPQPAQQPV
jgi:hypothetical protein